MASANLEFLDYSSKPVYSCLIKIVFCILPQALWPQSKCAPPIFIFSSSLKYRSAISWDPCCQSSFCNSNHPCLRHLSNAAQHVRTATNISPSFEPITNTHIELLHRAGSLTLQKFQTKILLWIVFVQCFGNIQLLALMSKIWSPNWCQMSDFLLLWNVNWKLLLMSG